MIFTINSGLILVQKMALAQDMPEQKISTDFLLDGLKSKDESTRVKTMLSARKSLTSLTTEQTLATFNVLLNKDSSSKEMVIARENLRIMGNSQLPLIHKKSIEALSSKDKSIKLMAIKTLFQSNLLQNEVKISGLRKALTDDDDDIRLEASSEFCNIIDVEDDVVLDLTQRIISDSNKDVRSNAAIALSKIKNATKLATPKLKEYLQKTTDKSIQYSIVNALGMLKITDDAVLTGLSRALEDQDNIHARFLASSVLIDVGKAAKPMVTVLRKALQDSDYRVRANVAHILGNMGEDSTEAIPEIVERALLDQEEIVRESSVLSIKKLSKFSRTGTIEILNQLSNSNNLVRERAARAIELHGAADDQILNDRIITKLAHLILDDFYPNVSRAAATALKNLGAIAIKTVMPEIKKALTNKNPSVFLKAAEACRILGKDAIEAEPELKALIASPDYFFLGIDPARIALDLMKEKEWPFLSNKNDSLCKSLKFILENKEWSDVSGHISELWSNHDSWDVAVESLQQIFLKKSSILLQKNEPTQTCNIEETKKIESFAASINNLIRRSNQQEDPLWGGVDIYARSYRLAYLKMIGKTEEAKQFEKLLIEDINELKGTGGNGSSAFSTHAYGVSMLAVGNSIQSMDLIEHMKNWVNSFQDPMALSYNPEKKMPYTLKMESRRSASARNIPIHLALLLADQSEKSRENMIEALSNWWKYSGDLASEVPRNGTHQGTDNLAPYYFYSSLPYVTAAIKTLERDPKISGSDKIKVVELKNTLRKSLPKLINESGLLLLPGGPKYNSTSYISSPAYTYPLFGLAILPLLQEGDYCYHPQFKHDFGILIQ